MVKAGEGSFIVSDTISYHYKAIELLKHWSSMLQLIETLIFIAIIVLMVFGNQELTRKCWRSLFAALFFTVLSIVFGLNVLGTLPWSTQQLPRLSGIYGDIYQFPNYFGIRIWVIAFSQHLSAVVGLAWLLYHIFLYLKQEWRN